MVQAEFLFELLMRLLADPSRFDCRRQPLERGLTRQVRHVVFLLPGRSPLADGPDLVARHVLHAVVEHPVFVTLRNADTASRKEPCHPTSGAAPPVVSPPCLT